VVQEKGYLYVADGLNHRITRYLIPACRENPCGPDQSWAAGDNTCT
jgi:hypothetical protein